MPSTSCDVNGRCQPSPRNSSLAQSVSRVPGPPSATASHHITQSERMKIGSARMRCVTMRSILSDSVRDARRAERLNVSPTIFPMYS